MLIYSLVFIIFLSFIAITFIIGRKLAYLKKISPEILVSDDTLDKGFFKSFFKEPLEHIQSLNIRGESLKLLAEVEKLLRRFKVIFLKIERYISDLILNIQQAVKEQERIMAEKKQAVDADLSLNDTKKELGGDVFSLEARSLDEDDKNALKNNEKTPILDINYTKEAVHRNESKVSAGVVIDDFAESRHVLKIDEQRLIMAIAKSPRDANLYADLGDVYFQLKQFDDSAESYQYCLKLDPDNYIVKTKLAKVLRNRD